MAETQTAKTKKKAPAPKAGGKKACTAVEGGGCKRAYRAKGLCFFHYKKWRRGELEKKPGLGAPRYDTCGKESCKKKVVGHGLCQDHFDAWKASRKSATLKKKAPAAEAAAT
jgi:hypothetical protein